MNNGYCRLIECDAVLPEVCFGLVLVPFEIVEFRFMDDTHDMLILIE
ncbi:hypothetical protein [Aminobacter sp. DSM 101952]|nr:hypothetical protein [Aminobacter sp. DSM 101952]